MRMRRGRAGIDLGEEPDLNAAIAGSSLGGVVVIDGAVLGVAGDADVRRVERGVGRLDRGVRQLERQPLRWMTKEEERDDLPA